MNSETPLVSICCITYNHERYLSEALESFLRQKAGFGIEILVHEDASTDGTAEIVRHYQRTFPGRVVGVFQTVNQYSKGVDVSRILWNRARGKYIAWCEGDDYWLDDEKLSKQVEFMEHNPDFTLCVHAAQLISDSGRHRGYVCPSAHDRDFDVPEVISAGGALFPSSSMLFTRQSVLSLPDYYERCSFKDYPLVMHLALQGGVRYLSDCMSVYRGARDGWTANLGRDARAQLRVQDELLQLLAAVDEFTNGEHHAVIARTSRGHEFARTVLSGDAARLSAPEFASLYSSQPLPWRGWVQLRTRWPRSAARLSRLRRSLKMLFFRG